jgi:hypothetical protein
VGVWSSTALAGIRIRAREAVIPSYVGLQLRGPTGQGLACSTGYSFSKSWHGEAFHELVVQSADVSALLCALPQSRVSPASQQSPWIMEVRRSVDVSWSPSWISLCGLYPL